MIKYKYWMLYLQFKLCQKSIVALLIMNINILITLVVQWIYTLAY